MKNSPKDWMTVHSEGLYCIPGQFYIDPILPVSHALITHGHADHARSGHDKVLATPATIAILQTRYGQSCSLVLQDLSYYNKITHNEVIIYFLPAGHILGSAQIVLEYKGSRLIISGDYKRAYDPTCEGFVVEHSDVFITEATFSLPVFKHPPIELELQKLLNSITLFPTNCHLVGAYALGKCQRIIMTLRAMGYYEPVYLHGALLKLCELYISFGMNLGDIQPALSLTKNDSRGKIVLCPPSALQDRWSRRFADPIIAYASGWMQIRARAKQKGIDLPLVISDHADWLQLTQTINEINPQEVWVTHGQEEALVYHTLQLGIQAKALSLMGYEETSED